MRFDATFSSDAVQMRKIFQRRTACTHVGIDAYGFTEEMPLTLGARMGHRVRRPPTA